MGEALFHIAFGADQLCLLDRNDLILDRRDHCAVACRNWAATRKVKRRVHLQAGGNIARSLAQRSLPPDLWSAKCQP